MKNSLQFIFTFILTIFVSFNSVSQTDSIKSIDNKEKELYSKAEENYMQKWVAENVDEMKLTNYEKAEYYKVLFNHVLEMNKLDAVEDKHTGKELKTKLNCIVERMNLKMKTFLNNEQYELHYKVFDKVIWNVSLRKGWN